MDTNRSPLACFLEFAALYYRPKKMTLPQSRHAHQTPQTPIKLSNGLSKGCPNFCHLAGVWRAAQVCQKEKHI
jgi:hypothetical protein